MSRFATQLGSLDHYEKGRVEVIDDDPRNYAFSNMFEVASRSKPYEQVAVGRNRQYVLEVLRAEGSSAWRVCSHDQSALVMDGQVAVELVQAGEGQRPGAEREGSVALGGEPAGPRMGRVVARRGHMTLLPAGAAYRFSAERPSVLLLQTIAGEDTVYRWADICQTA